MSNTAFDLRLKMVEMAKDYLDRQYEIATAAYTQSMSEAQKLGKAFAASMPKMYDPTEILKIAEQFNTFVSRKNG